MIGTLLFALGSYGEALVQNACHVLNKRPLQLNQQGVEAQDDPLDCCRGPARRWNLSTTARVCSS